jgi:hypothetical protein
MMRSSLFCYTFVMAPTIYKLRSKVWVYPGMAAWRFIGIPKKEGDVIKKKFGAHAKGWGSLPVSVTIGDTTWDTSIFPDKKSGSYLLPLKAKIRKAEGIDDDSMVSYHLRLR